MEIKKETLNMNGYVNKTLPFTVKAIIQSTFIIFIDIPPGSHIFGYPMAPGTDNQS